MFPHNTPFPTTEDGECKEILTGTQMKLGNVVAAVLLFLGWLFAVIGMGTLAWISGDYTTSGIKVEVGYGLLRGCVKVGGSETCDSLKSSNGCGGVKHGGGFAFTMLLFAVFTGLAAIVTNALAGVEMEVGPLTAELAVTVNFILSCITTGLIFAAWFIYACAAYSAKCYKRNSLKPGYSFALVITAWFIFFIPATVLNACEFLGIAIPGLVDGEKATAKV